MRIQISIHAAREGGDVRPYIKPRHPRLFQSTPPVKAATLGDFFVMFALRFISIHAAREGGDHDDDKTPEFNSISIHAAREGGDAAIACFSVARSTFQSTPPVKAATST